MISHRLSNALKQHYRITKLSTVQLLAGGNWNTSISLKADNRDLVLRISYPTVTASSVSYEHALLRYLATYIPEVPAPILGDDGSTYLCHNGRILTLFPLMPGCLSNRDSDVLRLDAARMLAQVHKFSLNFAQRESRPNYPCLSQLDWENNRMWNWQSVVSFLSLKSGALDLIKSLRGDSQTAFEMICSRLLQIETEKNSFRDWIAALTASGRNLLSGPVHGDFYPNNLLVEGERISAVLDWDDCQREWLTWELGRTIWEFCRDDEKLNLNQSRAEAFIEAYIKAGGPIPNAEFDLLVPFMRCVRLVEVLFGLGDALRGEKWYPQYLFRNLVYLENLQDVQLV